MELLMAVAILGIVVLAIHAATTSMLSAYEAATGGRDLLRQGRLAMDRMVMFARETDAVAAPTEHSLEARERVLDVLDNLTLAYIPEGDGFLDADRDGNGILNDDDGREWVRYRWDANDRTLVEALPDYTTPDRTDTLPETVLCENVSSFTCRALPGNLAQLELALSDGREDVVLRTRVRARKAPVE